MQVRMRCAIDGNRPGSHPRTHAPGSSLRSSAPRTAHRAPCSPAGARPPIGCAPSSRFPFVAYCFPRRLRAHLARRLGGFVFGCHSGVGRSRGRLSRNDTFPCCLGSLLNRGHKSSGFALDGFKPGAWGEMFRDAATSCAAAHRPLLSRHWLRALFQHARPLFFLYPLHSPLPRPNLVPRPAPHHVLFSRLLCSCYIIWYRLYHLFTCSPVLLFSLCLSNPKWGRGFTRPGRHTLAAQ
ncbi:hypothetical protein K505DRAFT_145087 [Melanomma pulvis-pyrius CBS 109.77]|uniref:Uncharacterized protein n=1 Tax=Melanomma pulvis-pyrius CBS 109.77 TaxID=1314802 RepID=A0A6A6WRF5_9PLEO|nr:hypothetical protein K505DRAFT_145087 [Melanomma pulvis-pyrius CBS 109.77]